MTSIDIIASSTARHQPLHTTAPRSIEPASSLVGRLAVSAGVAVALWGLRRDSTPVPGYRQRRVAIETSEHKLRSGVTVPLR